MLSNRQTHRQTDPTTVPSLRMRTEGNSIHVHSIQSGHYLPVQSPTAYTKVVEKSKTGDPRLRKVTITKGLAFGGNLHSSQNPCSTVTTISHIKVHVYYTVYVVASRTPPPKLTLYINVHVLYMYIHTVNVYVHVHACTCTCWHTHMEQNTSCVHTLTGPSSYDIAG